MFAIVGVALCQKMILMTSKTETEQKILSLYSYIISSLFSFFAFNNDKDDLKEEGQICKDFCKIQNYKLLL